MSEYDVILSHLDVDARLAIFESFWRRVEASAVIDTDALRACIRLLASSEQAERLISKQNQIVNFIHASIPSQPDDHDFLYGLADICSGDFRIGQQVFHRLFVSLQDFRPLISQDSDDPSVRDQLSVVLSFLRFLKCSFWLPSQRPHFVTNDLIQLLLELLGHDDLDGPVQETLSGLFTLLEGPVVVFHPDDDSKPPCWTTDLPSTQSLFPSGSLWNRLENLPSSYFNTDSSRIFRTWFQWISLASSQDVDIDAIYQPAYWRLLRIGLLSGFAEQRKYCLGILRQSLVLARRDINVPFMVLEVDRRSEYSAQYEKYSSLFETIVLDRYPNQIQASLPGLTSLFVSGSLISSVWTTALLSGVLHPHVQDGARKIVGNWYIDFVVHQKGPLEEHAQFLIEGFLPWATQGSLFTHSLISTRSETVCTHGQALADVLSVSLQAIPKPTDRRNLFVDILNFIFAAGGKLFHYAIIYILEGLKDALFEHENDPSYANLGADELQLVYKISRLPGLPEIATELCLTLCAMVSRSCVHNINSGENAEYVPGLKELEAKYISIKSNEKEQQLQTFKETNPTNGTKDLHSLQSLLTLLEETKHTIIQGNDFVSYCDQVSSILDSTTLEESQHGTLYTILEALWEEADRQEFRRPVAVGIPALFFHAQCIDICVSEQTHEADGPGLDSLTTLLVKAMEQLWHMSGGRSYLLSTFADSLRKAGLLNPKIIEILPFEDFLVSIIENPPLAKKEFLFEVASAEMLTQYNASQTYQLYYGKREWHAYACLIDLLIRFPESEIQVAKRLLKRLLEPWRTQKRPIPIISKWKDTLQLQAMLLLVESCVDEQDAVWYLDTFMSMLIIEQWPRYRYLIEWIISRIYYRFPQLAQRILPDLESLDDTVPVQIASLIKLAVLATPFLDSEQFTHHLVTLFIPFSASPKVHIRHEAHWSFPIIYGIAEEKRWTSITENPAFSALNKYIRSLDKFNSPATTIRTLRLDAVEDFTLVDIFQGKYLTIESPDRQYVAGEDFETLWNEDSASGFSTPAARISLGASKDNEITLPIVSTTSQPTTTTTADLPTAPLQTKSGFDLASLLPSAGPPSASKVRPASVLLVASLIDNPTNLGGLSRISESFGLEALYVNDTRCTGSKDFQSTAVTSHKHLPIRELKIAGVPEFLISMKRSGYEVVGVEQTDRSGILGEDPAAEVAKAGGNVDFKGDGTLPKKCVLVLGSEKGGITAEVLAVVDRCVEIRTVGVTRSLNVQTAGGIAVYEWWREWGGAK
ncbi:hypothetical protein BU24DRAFT_397600 [Aaosphaeria arxii CBS 175.79]|uniref:tRNA/rRNA methyltransferase SpoU type domain-containing protein n=1 Tax=Aaosphaeria arxii CBS 175.79 TaxID=1450172 RepID=A0A6A5XE93_9PLEO|nr:uncharacterized protein BU24DRAFT_397600 [Aaosphaeria arxii CBS 175.79]KAF2011220.1 hypothetical protein BU24DRAFT_397600 [Aaosphaeria arxii CBS 175.79]